MLCADGQSAIDKFARESFDICLLDVMMPNKDGFAVAKKIRQQTDQIPILFITAKSLEEDRIHGFEVGADDYIVKPFSMQELLLRIDVFLRRTKKMYSEKALNFQIGKMNFSFNDLKLSVGGTAFNMTQKEAELLLFLCEHPNRILKREEVLLNVWGKDDYFLGRSMDVFITKLRKYFRGDTTVQIETIHGMGFRLNASVH
jgi:DNA-binding response OmpR family regulator